MFRLDMPQKNPLFDYYAPEGSDYLGLVSIPHSGETIPSEFEEFLSGDLKAYKEDVDYKVNELVDIQALQKSGVAVIVAHVHRVCVDLNRNETQCVLFWKENTHGKKLVKRDPDPQRIIQLIGKYHRPYFETLKAMLLDLEKRKNGPVSMIDLHSMPSAPTPYHMKQNPIQKQHRPDFCLSDRKGKTCTPEFIKSFRDKLNSFGYETTLNDPYIGGYVTEYVDNFITNNIQIEINRNIYMDEGTKELITSKVKILNPILTQTLIEGFKKFNS